MKNPKLIFVLIVFLFAASPAAWSQHRITLNAGASFPAGVFGSDNYDVDGAGGAAGGAIFGLNYSYSFKKSPFGLFGEFDFIVNGLTTALKRDYVKQFEAMGISNADFRYSSYYNIPFTTGLNLNIKLKDKIYLFANVGGAVDFLKYSDTVVSVYNESVTISTDMDMVTGFKVGGGFHFDKLSLVFNYLGLGKHKLESTLSSGPYSQALSSTQKVAVMTLTLGIKL